MPKLPDGYLHSRRELFIHSLLQNLIFKIKHKHKTCFTELSKIWIIYDSSTQLLQIFPSPNYHR